MLDDRRRRSVTGAWHDRRRGASAHDPGLTLAAVALTLALMTLWVLIAF